MPVERRERVIAIWLGSTGNGRNPMFNGRRQPSRGGTSRMMREYQVRFCERLGVKFPGPTRHFPAYRTAAVMAGSPQSTDINAGEFYLRCRPPRLLARYVTTMVNHFPKDKF